MKCNVLEKMCSFRGSEKQCRYPAGHCYEIVLKCEGCERVFHNYCSVYAEPKKKWPSIGNCPMATHIKRKQEETKKVNPLKASKKKGKK